MNKLLLTTAIGSALVLASCGNRDAPPAPEPTPVTTSRIAFEPSAGTLPTPNDLLFTGSTDGTLQPPAETGTDYLDPAQTLGALDGWSTNMPITITVDLPTDNDGKALTLKATSVATLGAVRLFEVVAGGPLAKDPNCVQAPALSVCKISKELKFGSDFIAQAIDNAIVIVPLKPLSPKTSYLYTTTELPNPYLENPKTQEALAV